MIQTDSKKSGIDNIRALVKHTYPALTRIVNASNLALAIAEDVVADEEGRNMQLVIEGISDTVTGTTTLFYWGFDLTTCECPSEIGADAFTLGQLRAYMAAKPIAYDELIFTQVSATQYTVTATEGAFTCFGSKDFFLAEEEEEEVVEP